MRATAFDELAAAMHEFGYWGQLEAIEVALDKDDDDVPDELLLRELGVLPLLRIPNPNQAPTCLFQGRGVLRFLGFTVAQIRDGFNDNGSRAPPARRECDRTIATRSTMRPSTSRWRVQSDFVKPISGHWWSKVWCRGGRLRWLHF